MDVGAYLERIRYTGDLTPDAATLAALQTAHLETVPFENLSIHWNEPIVLEVDRLFRKVVPGRRGGFCYELNGLFGSLLAELGFPVTFISAGVAHGDGDFGPNFDHMTLVVTLDERWLVDVGFGDSFRVPLRLDVRDEQSDGWRTFRVTALGDDRVLERMEPDGTWMPQYRFTEQARTFDEYVPMCTYHQTSPDSHFTSRRIASLATPEGRITLSDSRLIETTGIDAKAERELVNDDEIVGVLRDVFGIERGTPTWVYS